MSVENGLFWLRETPQITVPGRMIIDGDGTTSVELLGGVTPEFEVTSHDPDTGLTTSVPAQDPADFVVHGILTDSPRAVSFLGCWTSRRTTTHTATGSLEQTNRAGRTHVTRSTLD
ncbi:hypothetical protein [Actinoplanes utahensis]|uniref:ApeA N-terminal domain 1-containing protein n=1 Tax=Actinoplanes utahensis TaxID=1869 RepID=UPI00126A5A29|nr:hypothetical protein [Actinoplanes utahensis]GIF35373.1 hypothetical protein Aut01nite_83590 [Actinoplanes utahensis]